MPSNIQKSTEQSLPIQPTLDRATKDRSKVPVVEISCKAQAAFFNQINKDQDRRDPPGSGSTLGSCGIVA